jgi:uncharacterized protein
MVSKIIDFHCHVGEGDEGYDLPIEDLTKSMDKNNISSSVIFPFSDTHENLIKKSLELLKFKSKRFFPFLRFNPNNITTDELDSLLNKGFCGVKLHPFAQNFNPNNDKFLWIFKKIADEKLPLLVHSYNFDENSHPKNLFELAKKIPELNIVIAHFCGNDLGYLFKASEYKNLFVDISINSRTLRIEMAAKKGVKQIFASDAPFDSQRVPLVKIEESRISDIEKENILYNYASKLLKIK